MRLVHDLDQGATMNNRSPRQLELFSDGARAVAACSRPKPSQPTETDLQARLDAARMRLHEIVILRMKTWLPEEMLKACARPKRSSGSRSDYIFACWSKSALDRRLRHGAAMKSKTSEATYRD
jgi:hypothetical protein